MAWGALGIGVRKATTLPRRMSQPKPQQQQQQPQQRKGELAQCTVLGELWPKKEVIKDMKIPIIMSHIGIHRLYTF